MVAVPADEVLALSVSAEILCNRSPRDENQDVQREARPCWRVFVAESLLTRRAEPSGESISKGMDLADLVERSGFVEEGVHYLVPVEGAGGCTSRSSLVWEAEYGLQIEEQTLEAAWLGALGRRRRLFATEEVAVGVRYVDLEPPVVLGAAVCILVETLGL